MVGSRKWSVESKEFEILIKVGAAGVRLFERSKGKQRTIFLKRDELAWLVGIVKEVVSEETSKVFWDQSRAGYPRFIAQKCSNRHGRFLTFEEFEGRRRCGTILVPEGRRGQGWVRIISELGLVYKELNEDREDKEVKKYESVRGRRSYVEAMGLSMRPEDDCFNSFTKPIAAIPKWLKVASTELGVQAQRVGIREKAPELTLATTELGDEQCRVSTKLLARQVQGGELSGGGVQKSGNNLMEVPASLNPSPVKFVESTKATVLAGYGSERGLQGDGIIAGLTFNDLQELSRCRVSLVNLKDEVDIGLRRLDRVLSKLEGFGSGQAEKESRAMHVASPKEKNNWTRPNFKKTIKHLDRVGLGVLGAKPSYALHVGLSENGAGLRDQAGPSEKLPAMASEDAGDQVLSSTAPAKVTEIVGGSDGDDGVILSLKGLSGGAVSATSSASIIPESLGDMGQAVSATVRPKVPVEVIPGEGGVSIITSGAAIEIPSISPGGTGKSSREGWLVLGSVGSAEGSQKERGEVQEVVGVESTMMISKGEWRGRKSKAQEVNGSPSEPKQLRVFKRKEALSVKPTKSWVAERCVWNDEEGSLGKNLAVCLDSVEGTVRATSEMVEPEMKGVQGEMEVQTGEFPCVEGAGFQNEVVALAENFERKEQGKESESPALEELEFVWGVKGIAGLSDGGQERKLKEVLGQIVTNKFGNGVSSSAGIDAEDNMREDDRFYEA